MIESPYAGDVAANVAYLEECIRDSLARGEAPYASHGFFPGALDDNDPEQRALGIQAGFAWGECAEVRVFYLDLGMSPGMVKGLAEAKRLGQQTEQRWIR